MRMRRMPLLLALALLGGCRSESPEAQVRKAFETCRAAVEAGDAGAATAALDPAFQGPEGMDRATARLILLGTLRQEKVGLTLVRSEVLVRRLEADQDVDLLITSRNGSLLPQEVSRRSYHLHWRKVGGQWLLRELLPG